MHDASCGDNHGNGLERAVVRLVAAEVTLALVAAKSYAVLNTPGLDPVDRPFLIAPTLLFAGLQWLVLEALLLLRLGRMRRAVGVFAVVWLATCIGVLGLRQISYFKTGVMPDLFMVRYAWAHRAELWPVISSELRWGTLAVGVCLLLFVFLPVLAARLRTCSAAVRQYCAPRHVSGLFIAGLLTVVGGAAVLAAPHSDSALDLYKPDVIAFFGSGNPSAGALSAFPSKSSEERWTQVRLLPTPTARRYNIVMVILESVRATATTPYNPTLDTTPFLARLAEIGRMVRRAYTVVPHTTKALVSILCGIYPKIDTGYDEALPGGIPVRCLPALLHQYGYATAFMEPGEAEFEDGAVLVKNMGYDTFVSKESIGTTTFDESNYFGYEDRAVLKPALSWLDEHKGRPFLLTILTLATHHDYRLPRGLKARTYEDDNDDLNRYLNLVHYSDGFLESLYEGLAQRGLLDDTLFIVLADHGEGFGEHGRYQHDTTIYEEGLRIPIVLSGPGIDPAAGPVEGLRQTLDILPTVLDVLGLRLEGESRYAGSSLLKPATHKRLFASCWYRNYCMAVITSRYKYIYHENRLPDEVFDLLIDPAESNNLLLSSREARNDMSHYRELLIKWRAGVLRWYRSWDQYRSSDRVADSPFAAPLRVDVQWGTSLRLYGLSSVPETLRRGEILMLDVYYEAIGAIPSEWRLYVRVTDSAGNVVYHRQHAPVFGTHPLRAWRRGQFVHDTIWVPLPGNLSPGAYRLYVGVNRTLDPGDRMSTVRPKASSLPVTSDGFAKIGEVQVRVN